MQLPQQILSDITIYTKYARYNENKKRRETWEEIVTRNKDMHLKKYPMLKEDIEDAYTFVYNKKILPSMRSLQFAGKAIEVNPARIYNCCFTPVDHWKTFSEIMFLLLCGTGVGFSVQNHHIDLLPEIIRPNQNKTKRYLIGDSIEGWSDAIKILMKSYFFGGLSIRFDYSDIREKGAVLITSGGKAPGPQPLRECLVKIEGILSEKENGDKLSTIEAYDIICHIADAVLAGGIRRAALICIFSADDMDMVTSKTGDWWEYNPQRGRSNNSAMMLRSRVRKKFFMDYWSKIKDSKSGEPGFYFSNDKDWGSNPCVEIAMRPNQFCNLTEINVSDVESQEDFNSRAKAAALIGTLQAGYTDFHYLRSIWRKTTEKDALIGVSMTGIASMKIFVLDQNQTATIVIEENKRIAKLIGIKQAARTTCVKPAGTTSLALGTSSGVHSWYDQYYIRRMKVGKNEAIYKYLKRNHPSLVVDDHFRPHDTAQIEIPQKAPIDAVTRNDETALSLLERVKDVSMNWIKPGHRTGMNSHNVSVTINLKDNEWKEAAEWCWGNRQYYNGMALFPHDSGTYMQAPFETIDEETYNRLVSSLEEVDLSKINEEHDATDLQQELACVGGSCEIV